MRTFLAVVRHGSLTAASGALGVSQPTLSRHIRALEEALGTPLFVRNARGVTPTERGQVLAGEAVHVEEAMVRLGRLVTGSAQALTGTVRLAASEAIGVEVLVPALPALAERHPGLSVELVLDNTPADLLRGHADLAVRLFRPQQADLLARLVGTVALGLYGTSAYFDARGRPRTVEALLDHPLIGFDPQGPLARAMTSVEPRLSEARFALRTDSLSAQLAAARAGFGLAVLQRPIAARYRELELAPIAIELPPVPLWIVTHRDLRTAASVRAVSAWAEETLADHAGAAAARDPDERGDLRE